MAKENIKKFFEEVSKNAELKKQLKAATEKNDAEIEKALNAQAEAVVSVAKGAGFDFTAKELFESTMLNNGKLDEGELDNVAGGVGGVLLTGPHEKFHWPWDK